MPLNDASTLESTPAIQSAFADSVAARSGAAVFDVCHRGQVELSGSDAALFLHNLSTNDIKNLQPGRGCEFFLTNNKARVVAHGFAHRLLPAQPPLVWLDVDPGSAGKVTAHLNHYLVTEQVEIADRTSAWCQLHLCGPQAAQILQKAVPEVPPLEPLQHVNAGGMRIIRHDYLGLPGFDLVCPASDVANCREALLKAGAIAAGLEAFNILRVEAGVPVDGIDMDADRFVVEIGRTKQAICYTKGCYLGQEPIVMARDRGHINRMLLGLKVNATLPLPAGAKIIHNGQEVGQVTSSVWSPLVGTVIALAFLKRGSQEPGTTLEVEGQTAVVENLPFRAN